MGFIIIENYTTIPQYFIDINFQVFQPLNNKIILIYITMCFYALDNLTLPCSAFEHYNY